MDEIAIGRGELVLDAGLTRGQHQFLELAMRGEQHLGGRRLERDATLEADDRVAEMDAATDAERRRHRFEVLDQRHRRHRLTVEREQGTPDSKPIV